LLKQAVAAIVDESRSAFIDGPSGINNQAKAWFGAGHGISQSDRPGRLLNSALIFLLS
jgi:hypothetical protein